MFDNLSTGSKKNLLHLDDNPNFNFVYGDTLDISALQSVLDVSDIVFHLAANPSVALGAHHTRKDFEQNVIGTYNLIEAMRKSTSCKKILFASTSTVYGEVEAPKMLTPETLNRYLVYLANRQFLVYVADTANWKNQRESLYYKLIPNPRI